MVLLLGLCCALPALAATPLEGSPELPTATDAPALPPSTGATPRASNPATKTADAAPRRAPLRALEAAGTGAWREVSGPNFRVLSDASEAVSRALVDELELLRQGLLTPLGLAEARGGVDVILFADREGYARYAGKGSVAKTSWRTQRPLMLLWARSANEGPRRSLLAHELTHALSHAALGRQPRWVAEGLAEVLERLQISDDGTRATLPPAHTSPRWTRTAGRELLPMSALWRWDARIPPRTELPRYYAAAWGWTSFLRARHPAQLAAFHAALGTGADARGAFTKAFAGQDPEALRREARAWLGQGEAEASSWTLVTPTQPAEVRQVELTGADATVVLAWLRLLGFDGRSIEERRALAGRSLASVLKTSPSHVGAAHLASLLDADWASEEAALSELR